MKKLFDDIPVQVVDEEIPQNYFDQFLGKLLIGGGDTSINIEKGKGLWIGNKKFSLAGFSVNPQGLAKIKDMLLEKLLVGAGDNSIHIKDGIGLWIGAEEFADAPFSVDMDGNVVSPVEEPTVTTNFLAGSGTRTTGDDAGIVTHNCGFKPDLVKITTVGGPEICFGRITGSDSNDCDSLFNGGVLSNSSLCVLIARGTLVDFTSAVGTLTVTGFRLDFNSVYYDTKYKWEAFKLK